MQVEKEDAYLIAASKVTPRKKAKYSSKKHSTPSKKAAKATAPKKKVTTYLA